MGGRIRLGVPLSVLAAHPELLAEDKIFLVCDGLDTLATVVLNGHELGQHR